MYTRPATATPSQAQQRHHHYTRACRRHGLHSSSPPSLSPLSLPPPLTSVYTSASYRDAASPRFPSSRHSSSTFPCNASSFANVVPKKPYLSPEGKGQSTQHCGHYDRVLTIRACSASYPATLSRRRVVAPLHHQRHHVRLLLERVLRLHTAIYRLF